MSDHFLPSLPHHCVYDIDEVNRRAANELTRFAEWMARNSAQQISLAQKKDIEKTMSNEVKLIAGYPESKPFWADLNKNLHCFVCDFTQLCNKSYEKQENLPWMTKRVKKGGSEMVISFCPACMSGEPWTLHYRNSYTTIDVAPEGRKPHHPLVVVEDKTKNDENWLNLPPDVPYYRNKWTSSELFEKPYDWRHQESQYDSQKKLYEAKKETYDTFCTEKLAQIPKLTQPTMEENVKNFEDERLRIHRERFALRSSKRHNLSGFRPAPKLTKKQDESDRHPFNSPSQAAVITNSDKENAQNAPN